MIFLHFHLLSNNLTNLSSPLLSIFLLHFLADLVYNLFATTSDANINASLVLDQLEGTLHRQCSTINEIEEPETEELKSEKSGTNSDNPDAKSDNISIQSYDIISEIHKSNLTENRTLTGSLKDFRVELSENPDTPSENPKPDLIHISEVRKAFWKRKNKFTFPKSKRFGFLRKNSNKSGSESGNDPRLGAIVSLAALAAGMTSFPIVHQQNDENPENSEKLKNPDNSDNPEKLENPENQKIRKIRKSIESVNSEITEKNFKNVKISENSENMENQQK